MCMTKREQIASIASEHKASMNVCLKCGIHPRLRFRETEKETAIVVDGKLESKVYPVDEFIFYCPSCRFQTEVMNSLLSAITSWHILNRPGSASHFENWQRFKEEQDENVHGDMWGIREAATCQRPQRRNK